MNDCSPLLSHIWRAGSGICFEHCIALFLSEVFPDEAEDQPELVTP